MGKKKKAIAIILALGMAVSSIQFPTNIVEAGELYEENPIVTDVFENLHSEQIEEVENSKEMEETVSENATKEETETNAEDVGVYISEDILENETEMESTIVKNPLFEKEETEEFSEDAAGNTNAQSDTVLITDELYNAVDNIAKGKVNDITWVIDVNGKLFVEGSGDYYSDSGSLNASIEPWYIHRENILSAEVKVTDLTSSAFMFDGCSSLSSVDVSNFDTSKVTNMVAMFQNCTSLSSLDLSSFDTSNVRDMEAMFNCCSSLRNLNINNFDTSNVYAISHMFSGCSSLSNLDVSNFNTSNVKYMGAMFSNCNNLSSLNLSNFDTNKVDYMPNMFSNCNNLSSLDLSSFDVSNVTNIMEIFDGCSKLSSIYTPRNLKLDVELPISTGDIWYQQDGTELTQLPQNLNKSILISKNDFRGPLITDELYNAADNIAKGKVNGIIWVIDVNGKLFVEGSGEFSGETGSDRAPWYENREFIISAEVSVEGITDLSGMFSGCENLTNVNLNELDTGKVTNMSHMFYYCSSLTSVNVSGFDTGKVTNMRAMFCGCFSLTSVDVSGFNTGKVTDMSFMFCYCNMTSVNVSGFDTEKVTNMSAMFQGCNSLTNVDVSGFDTRKVTDMGFMFSSCSNLTNVDVSGFDTGKVTNMNAMFQNCRSLTSIDLSGFDTGEVTDIGFMFSGCSNLTSLDLSGFDTEKVTDMSLMFQDCNSLTSLDLSSLDLSNVDSASNAFLRCSSLTIIQTPNNLKLSIVLPVDANTAWYCPDGTTMTELPKNLNESITLTRKTISELFTVKFKTNGGTSIDSQSVYSGGKVNKPEDPVRANYVFAGWYKDSNCTILWDFDKEVVTADVTLYAKWAEAHPYDVSFDAYSFKNVKSSFGYTTTSKGEDTYPIKWPIVKYIFGDNVKGKSVYKEMIRYDWNGNCCGMASSSALMFSDSSIPEQVIGSNDVHSLTIDQDLGEVDVKKFIEAMQVAQYVEQFSKDYNSNRIYKVHLDSGKTLNALCEAIKKDVNNGAGTVIAIGKEGQGAHALLAYGIEEDALSTKIKIYDCNYPQEERIITISKSSSGNANGWSYEMGGRYGVWGGTDPYCFISYIPFNTIEHIWKNRGHLYESRSLLQVNSENISIKNFEGQVVAELKDGKLVTDSEEIYEVPNLSLNESFVNAIYLPKDYYTVTTESSGEFEVSLSDTNSSASVQTTAKSISFAVDDDSLCNSVTIEDASARDTYTVSLDSSSILGNDSVKYDNVTVIGTGKDQSISISSIGGQISIANCNVESFLINGEEQVYYTITSSASDGGSISPEGDCKTPAGESCTFTFTPEPGYMVEYVLVDGVNLGYRVDYTFSKIGKNHNIFVQFKKRECSINEISFDKTALNLSVDYVCDRNAVLVGAIYGDDGIMLAFAKTGVVSSNKTERNSIQFYDIVLPQNYLIKVFLVDEFFAPLCEFYEDRK